MSSHKAIFVTYISLLCNWTKLSCWCGKSSYICKCGIWVMELVCMMFFMWNTYSILVQTHLTVKNVDTNGFPMRTQRNNNVIMTSKRRRFDVIMTLLLRRVSDGLFFPGEQDLNPMMWTNVYKLVYICIYLYGPDCIWYVYMLKLWWNGNVVVSNGFINVLPMWCPQLFTSVHSIRWGRTHTICCIASYSVGGGVNSSGNGKPRWRREAK